MHPAPHVRRWGNRFAEGEANESFSLRGDPPSFTERG